jgi:hypothetical protein
MIKPRNIKFYTDPSIRYNMSGIYMIKFSSKHFYIGCSKNITKRIQTHTVDLLYGKRGVKGIMAMGGFSGKVTFTLLEEVNAETHGDNWKKMIFDVEKKHQNKRWRSKYCLNRHTTRKREEKPKIQPRPSIPCDTIIHFLINRGHSKKRNCFPCKIDRLLI